MEAWLSTSIALTKDTDKQRISIVLLLSCSAHVSLLDCSGRVMPSIRQKGAASVARLAGSASCRGRAQC